MLLASAGAACACHAILAGEGGASRRVTLQPRLQVALLVVLLVHELVVLQRQREQDRQRGSLKKDATVETFIFMTV